MRNVVTTLVVGISCLAAGPATRPATTKPVKPLAGTRAVAALIPKDLLPESGRRWTELQQRAANAWVEKELRSMPIKIHGKVNSVSVNDVVGVAVEEGIFKDRQREFKGSVTLVFTDPATPGLAKLREGDTVSASGKIERVSLAMGLIYGVPETSVVLGVTVDDPKLEKAR
jgi:hypothetical protein